MPFLFIGLILALMVVANKKPAASSGASAGMLSRQTEPLYDIGEEVMLPKYHDWGVIEQARRVGDTWVYGVAISHDQRVRVCESDVCEG